MILLAIGVFFLGLIVGLLVGTNLTARRYRRATCLLIGHDYSSPQSMWRLQCHRCGHGAPVGVPRG